jgi:hypothetical protein
MLPILSYRRTECSLSSHTEELNAPPLVSYRRSECSLSSHNEELNDPYPLIPKNWMLPLSSHTEELNASYPLIPKNWMLPILSYRRTECSPSPLIPKNWMLPYPLIPKNWMLPILSYRRTECSPYPLILKNWMLPILSYRRTECSLSSHKEEMNAPYPLIPKLRKLTGFSITYRILFGVLWIQGNDKWLAISSIYSKRNGTILSFVTARACTRKGEKKSARCLSLRVRHILVISSGRVSLWTSLCELAGIAKGVC